MGFRKSERRVSLAKAPGWVWPLLVLSVLLGRRWRRNFIEPSSWPNFQHILPPVAADPFVAAAMPQPQEEATIVSEDSPISEESPSYPMAPEAVAEASESSDTEQASLSDAAATVEREPEVAEAVQAKPDTGEQPQDDLAIVNGIGPKISTVLQDGGIRTFKQLSETPPDILRQMMRAAGIRMADPSTWPEQAALAAAENWNGLREMQAHLTAERRGEG